MKSPFINCRKQHSPSKGYAYRVKGGQPAKPLDTNAKTKQQKIKAIPMLI